MKRFLIVAAAGLAFSAPAWADPVLGGISYLSYKAVDGDNNPVTDPSQVNPDGTFADTCDGCQWVPGVSTPSQLGYHTPVVGAANPKTGNATVAGADGVATVNRNGNYTVMSSGGLVTNGTVAAPTMYTQDSVGNTYHVGNTLNAHSALLSEHSAKLDEHSKGLAIAMALPDAWIESNKRFAIAGNIGGFGDETAIGAAVILRLDDVWSINGKLGADTGFEEFGWTAGARASW